MRTPLCYTNSNLYSQTELTEIGLQIIKLSVSKLLINVKNLAKERSILRDIAYNMYSYFKI